jgi:hypothetical protein
MWTCLPGNSGPCWTQKAGRNFLRTVSCPPDLDSQEPMQDQGLRFLGLRARGTYTPGDLISLHTCCMILQPEPSSMT